MYTDTAVDLVIIPGVSGDYGVTAGHTPTISELRPGTVEIFHQQDGEAEKFFISGGLQVLEQHGGVENKMMPHRRRGFEYKSMMNELLKRAKIAIPPPEIIKFPTQKFMIINTTSGAVIAE